mmetsp:Transcript_18202/g.34741  ORF Transcript_18202/g.34741 Transcript_18202/m.34741 type:complete len:195 (-) Transcript_18202:326-910(-)
MLLLCSLLSLGVSSPVSLRSAGKTITTTNRALSSFAAAPAQRSPISPQAANQLDIRRALPSLAGSKCIPVNNVATLCGKMVVLRSPTAVRAQGDDTTVDADKMLDDLTSKLNQIENKGQIAIYAGASVLAILVANGLITTIDAIPVLPYLTKLVGTGYTGWFVYRYLLFDDSRKELLEDLEAIRKKITGEGEMS